MSSGAPQLGELSGRQATLAIACSSCDRRGRFSVARLIEQHGADARLPDLREVLAGDCPPVGAVSTYERCGVRYPQLAGGATAG